MNALLSSKTIKAVSGYVTLLLVASTRSLPYQVALKDRGIDKLLEEAREDNKETDAAIMGRK